LNNGCRDLPDNLRVNVYRNKGANHRSELNLFELKAGFATNTEPPGMRQR
jgi:hypothetical protein